MRQIAADTEIDRLVYELYGLTEAEIRIVDCGLKPARALWDEVGSAFGHLSAKILRRAVIGPAP